MIDLRDYETDQLEAASSVLIRLWGSSDTIELPTLLDDLLNKIESLLDEVGQRDWERMGTDG